MQSSIYKDLIDEKISEWKKDLTKVEEQAEGASQETKSELLEKIKLIRPKINTAILELQKLDKKETVDNTMETKEKIMEIFNSIDKEFPHYEDITPYML